MKLKDISSSQLRDVIEIIHYTDGVDGDNIPIKVENVLGMKRARVDVPSLRRQENLIALGISVNKTLMFVIRYFEKFDTDNFKIRYKNKIYEIRGIENVEERNLYFNILGEYKD